MQLTRQDLWSLEDYASKRQQFRTDIIAHKKNRQVRIGEHMTLIFEDRMTIQYQIQEMLRIERVFEAEGIQEELDAYNPLIPDGDNWKCSLMLEYEDVNERKLRLQELVGVEEAVWIQVGDTEKIFPIADEDIDRADETKTSAVHFLRYQLPKDAIAALKAGAGISAGVNHPAYTDESVTFKPAVINALKKDID
ncbi:MAG: DUF3501 family protein [Gammaproteobacteria bacterium]|nr:DUF3501 family protein [Gammaproteobacteria bacterium]